MAVMHRGWMVGAGIGLVVVLGAAVSIAAIHSSSGSGVPESLSEARDLETPVSVHVVDGIDETACGVGSAGVPALRGPGCYLLGPGFHVTRAEKVEMGLDASGDFAVNVKLVPEDAVMLATWMESAVGSQIAYRVGDRVVSAPQVEASPGGDSVFLIPLTEAQAATLVKEMWP